MNNILITILTKMCEINEIDFNTINWDDRSHLSIPYKNENSEDVFYNWLYNYIYSLKISELKQIYDYPYILYKNKKNSKQFAINFISNYGFKTYDIDVIEERKNKILKIINEHN